jgi:hypothetical protein
MSVIESLPTREQDALQISSQRFFPGKTSLQANGLMPTTVLRWP